MQRLNRSKMGAPSIPRATPARLPMMNMMGRPDFREKHNVLPDVSRTRKHTDTEVQHGVSHPHGDQVVVHDFLNQPVGVSSPFHKRNMGNLKQDEASDINKHAMEQIQRAQMEQMQRVQMEHIQRVRMEEIQRARMEQIQKAHTGQIQSENIRPISREGNYPIQGKGISHTGQLIAGFHSKANTKPIQRNTFQSHKIQPKPACPRPGNYLVPLRNDVISKTPSLDRTFMGGNLRGMSLGGSRSVLPNITMRDDSIQCRRECEEIGRPVKQIPTSRAMNVCLPRDKAPLMPIGTPAVQEKQGEIKIVKSELAEVLHEDNRQHSGLIDGEMGVHSGEQRKNEENVAGKHFDDSIKVARQEMVGDESSNEANKLCPYERQINDDEYASCKEMSRRMTYPKIYADRGSNMASVSPEIVLEYESTDHEDGEPSETNNGHDNMKESNNDMKGNFGHCGKLSIDKRNDENANIAAEPEATSNEESTIVEEDSISYEEIPVPDGTNIVRTGPMKCVSHDVEIEQESDGKDIVTEDNADDDDTEDSISYQDIPVPEGTNIVKTGPMKCVSHDIGIEPESDGNYIASEDNVDDDKTEDSISYQEIPVPEGTNIVKTGPMKCVSHDVEIELDSDKDDVMSESDRSTVSTNGQNVRIIAENETKKKHREEKLRNAPKEMVNEKRSNTRTSKDEKNVQREALVNDVAKSKNVKDPSSDISSGEFSIPNTQKKKSGIIIARDPETVRRQLRKRKRERDKGKKSADKPLPSQYRSTASPSSAKPISKVPKPKPKAIHETQKVQKSTSRSSIETNDDITNSWDRSSSDENEMMDNKANKSQVKQLSVESYGKRNRMSGETGDSLNKNYHGYIEGLAQNKRKERPFGVTYGSRKEDKVRERQIRTVSLIEAPRKDISHVDLARTSYSPSIGLNKTDRTRNSIEKIVCDHKMQPKQNAYVTTQVRDRGIYKSNEITKSDMSMFGNPRIEKRSDNSNITKRKDSGKQITILDFVYRKRRGIEFKTEEIPADLERIRTKAVENTCRNDTDNAKESIDGDEYECLLEIDNNTQIHNKMEMPGLEATESNDIEACEPGPNRSENYMRIWNILVPHIGHKSAARILGMSEWAAEYLAYLYTHDEFGSHINALLELRKKIPDLDVTRYIIDVTQVSPKRPRRRRNPVKNPNGDDEIDSDLETFEEALYADQIRRYGHIDECDKDEGENRSKTMEKDGRKKKSKSKHKDNTTSIKSRFMSFFRKFSCVSKSKDDDEDI